MLARFRATLLLLFDLAILFLLHHSLLIYKSAATAFEINPSSFRYRTQQTIRSPGLRPTTMTIASSVSKEPIALAVPPLKESKKSIKAVLFDMDGTLLDTERLSDKALLMALFGKQKECTVDDLPLLPESLQKPPTSDWILPWTLKRQILGLRGKEWAPICLDFAREHEDDLPTVEELIDRWEKILSALCSEVEACDGAKVLIRNIIGCGDFKIPMAIATSSRMSGVEKKRIRHERHMFEHIDTIVTGDDPAVQNGKPAPDIYVEAARRLDVDPSECLVFEDALSGVKAGKAAGCQVVVIPDTRFTEDERIKLFVDEGGADVVLSSLWEFDGRPFGMDFDMNEISRMEEQKDK